MRDSGRGRRERAQHRGVEGESGTELQEASNWDWALGAGRGRKAGSEPTFQGWGCVCTGNAAESLVPVEVCGTDRTRCM